jgi:hypothetical protein
MDEIKQLRDKTSWDSTVTRRDGSEGTLALVTEQNKGTAK